MGKRSAAVARRPVAEGGEGVPRSAEPDHAANSHPLDVDPYILGCEPLGFVPDDFMNHCHSMHFWSLHSGGANFALGDGSVRFLRYTAADLLPALATRAGGESVTVPD